MFSLFLAKKGCTDPDAANYDSNAKVDNKSCKYTDIEVDIVYGTDPIQQLKLYLTKDQNTTTKVLLLVHGGGWVVGYNESSIVTTFENRYDWNVLNPLLEAGYDRAVMKYRTAC